MEKLKQYESKLIKIREELIHRTDRLNKNKTRPRSMGMQEADSIEQSVSVQNNEVIDRLEELDRIELDKVLKAIIRIEQGTYGKCVKCGDDISSKRLEAMPFANICMDCMDS